jgi:hypothetical protein
MPPATGTSAASRTACRSDPASRSLASGPPPSAHASPSSQPKTSRRRTLKARGNRTDGSLEGSRGYRALAWLSPPSPNDRRHRCSRRSDAATSAVQRRSR